MGTEGRVSVGRLLALTFVLSASAGQLSFAADFDWLGGKDQAWSTPGNWSSAGGPGVADNVLFTQPGSSAIAGNATNVLDADTTINSLRYRNQSGAFHTTDLQGHTLQLNGDLDLNFDFPGNSLATITGGDLKLGSADDRGNLFVARRVSNADAYVATLDLSGLDSLTAYVDRLSLGEATLGESIGQLRLAKENTIDAHTLLVGRSQKPTTGTGTNHLELGQVNTMLVDEWVVGDRITSGQVQGPSGGVLNLGSAERRANLIVSRLDELTPFYTTGNMNLSGMTLHGFLDNLTVALRSNSGSGGNFGTFNAGSGDLDIGRGVASDITIGHSFNDGATQGAADLSGLATLRTHVNRISVGTVVGAGSAQGDLRLADKNEIEASSLIVGDGPRSTASLTFGQDNKVLVDEFIVGRAGSQAEVKIVQGGVLTLGSAERRTSLDIGRGTVDLAGAKFDAALSQLVVGENEVGTLKGALHGTVTVGSEAVRGNFVVGGTQGVGAVDFSNLDSFTARVEQFLVGESTAGFSQGVVRLPDAAVIDARRIVVGSKGEGGASLLKLGRNATLLADEMLVGIDETFSGVEAGSGGEVSLGSPERPMRLIVGRGRTDTNHAFTGTLDLSGAAVTAHLSDLIVGQKDERPGSQRGTFKGGRSGSLSVGSPASRGQMIVGQTNASGVVDLSSMDSFVGHLDQLLVGVTVPGTVEGTLDLAHKNQIDANRIVVGSNGTLTSFLTLGEENTILANELVIGRDNGNGLVRAPAGSFVQLGAADRLMNLELAKGFTNTNHTFSGILDLSGSKVIAHLGQVILGDKNQLPGAERAELLFSKNPENVIRAQSISMGGNLSLGLLRFGGGTLIAGSIEKGPGEAIFEWTGGTVQVGQVGSAAVPMDLANTQAGILSPGDSPGRTEIFGNYTQGDAATLAIELAGEVAGESYDQLEVSKAAKLAGELQITALGGYRPASGLVFNILTAGSRSGQFDTIEGAELGGGLLLVPQYTADGLSLLTVLQGDANNDSTVDLTDFGVLKNNFGVNQDAWAGGDFNGDSNVDLSDFGLLKANFGATTGVPATALSVPEPSTGLLLVVGAGCGALVVRRRRGCDF